MRRIPLIALALLGGCMVGPDYQRADAPDAPAFKEAPAGWKLSTPVDALPKGNWWAIYRDPALDALERQVAISNQNVKSFEAQYRQAQAIADEARSQEFPTVGVSGGVTRSHSGGTGSSGLSSAGGRGARTLFTAEASASWDLDLWGRIRRQAESDVAGAQVSAADLANATLSAQSTLATDYFQLRAQDALTQLLTDTVKADQEALRITQNQYNAGTAAPSDVAQAETQLAAAQAQLIAAGVQRQSFEHAIAVLTGVPPAALTLPPGTLATEVPVVPAGLPSSLLERRPDIAAAERAMAAQNALIGVAVAAYYPDISLSADYGFEGNPIGKLFRAANRLWSLGASASETLFDGGERSAAVRAAEASYDSSVATYRQTVLTAFQQVEDQLSALRILEQQSVSETEAVRAASRSRDIALNEYRAGTVAYTTVVTAQTALLGDQEAALTVQENRMVASATLVAALGGGWTAADLPSR
ncbi:MAG TPA: efflux transporter outer membrane subunit [Aliidongia sp.]|uniref:efflux transporter outer membrane subunit n=1 Tax=Aliidongia sp. TaxID=1914230 RepID=UPI002DDDB5B0|nr:efflux transporter outer membrane subunit [Aliidongia sp.]HEV2677570.1 efflux transporter outer membrane subunit [Aliidongia sp.]